MDREHDIVVAGQDNMASGGEGGGTPTPPPPPLHQPVQAGGPHCPPLAVGEQEVSPRQRLSRQIRGGIDDGPALAVDSAEKRHRLGVDECDPFRPAWRDTTTGEPHPAYLLMRRSMSSRTIL